MAMNTMKAEMLYTIDEPWGLLVRAHVSPAHFEDAARLLLDDDSDALENAEGWLCEVEHDEEGRRIVNIIGEPSHKYMRLDREDDPDLGEVYKSCKADDPGAIPITIVLY
jgi:hypothetical protein